MSQALRTFGRIIARHWPALMAWYLGGEALHRVLIAVSYTHLTLPTIYSV